MFMQPLKTLLSLSFFLLAFTIIIDAQTPIKNYEKQWKAVDDLILKKKLPKSALAEVKKI